MVHLKTSNMKPLRPILLCCLLIAGYSCTASNDSLRQRGLVLVGSTPGDSIIKRILDIPQQTRIDFIRWQLNLRSATSGSDSFQLDISFGEAKPNTMGFMDDHGKKNYFGTYTVVQPQNRAVHGRIYQLTGNGLAA